MNGRTPAPAMITSPHAEASACGAAVLAAGGNAVDAVLTTVAALGVTYPHFCGVGGDAFFLIAEARGAVHAVSGIGQAALDCQGYPAHQAIPLRGGRSALTTAGAVDAMAQAYAIGQTLGAQNPGAHRSWADLWAPAIALARDGYALSDSERFWLEFRQPEHQALAGIYAQYADAGNGSASPLQHRPQLAATLQELANQGPRAFYEGPLAERLAQGLAAAGSPLTTIDLAATRARREAPLRMAYRGGTLLAHPPPTQGLTTLGILGILNRFALTDWEEGSADYYHLLVEAVKRAFLDRNQMLCDPEF
jgi:gamma-glutamyltranspeptidase